MRPTANSIDVQANRRQFLSTSLGGLGVAMATPLLTLPMVAHKVRGIDPPQTVGATES